MQSELLFKNPENSLKDDLVARILNVRITHKRAPLSALEAFSFTNPQSIMKEITDLPAIDECLLIETCNRVEIYAVASTAESSSCDDLVNFWLTKKGFENGELSQLLETSSGSRALSHLLRVAAGLESMIVGEDQILGQIREAYKIGKDIGAVGSVLDKVLQFVLRVGKNVRSATAINHGAVSMGSAGVELLNDTLGDLQTKRILIVGAGETGELVGKALASRKAGIIFVANRTFRRAVEMAETLGARAIHFEDMEQFLVSADAVVVATSAPHFVLTLPMISQVIERRKGNRFTVVDLGEPRNADPQIAKLSGVILLDIDDLRGLARTAFEKRAKEAQQAENMVGESLEQLILMLKRIRVEPLISSLCRKAEVIRQIELGKAVARIDSEINNGSSDGQIRKFNLIAEDLSRSLVEALLYDEITNLRQSSANDQVENLLVAEKILGIQTASMLESATQNEKPKPKFPKE